MNPAAAVHIDAQGARFNLNHERRRSAKQRELEEYWRRRVNDARTVYLRTSVQHTRMLEELQHGTIAPADGSFAVAHARRAEAWARHELTRTVRIYADLVVKGIIPPSDTDEKLIG